jgi:hypothetical protein
LDDAIEATSSNCWDVFEKYKARVCFADKPCDVVKKSASLASQADANSCNTDILAGEPTADDVDSWQHIASER